MNFTTPPKEDLNELCNACIFLYKDFQTQIREKIILHDVQNLEIFEDVPQAQEFTENVDWELFKALACELVQKYNSVHNSNYDDFTAIIITNECQKEKDWDECFFLGKQMVENQNNVLEQKIDSMDIFKAQTQIHEA